jgi:hypothetical protein
VWEDVVALFRAANGMTKKVKNIIHRGLRWPPTNKSYTIILDIVSSLYNIDTIEHVKKAVSLQGDGELVVKEV